VDPAIVAAFIGAGASISVAIFSTIRGNRARADLAGVQQELGSISRALSTAHTALADAQRESHLASKALSNAQRHKYGFFADALKITVAIQDVSGSAVTQREWRGLQVSPQASMAAIPGFFTITNGEFVRYPEIIAKNDSFPKAVQMRHVRTDPRSCEYLMEIAGMLTADDPKLDCTVQVSHRGGFMMSREDVEAAFPTGTFRNEYQKVFVEIPLGEIQIDVKFPEGYQAECFHTVFIGHSETVDNVELNRIHPGFQRNKTGASLHVDGPLLGYAYAIYWVSPTAAELAAVK